MVCRMNVVLLRPEVSTTLSVGSMQYFPVYWPVLLFLFYEQYK
jgi:hypothetical protein